MAHVSSLGWLYNATKRKSYTCVKREYYPWMWKVNINRTNETERKGAWDARHSGKITRGSFECSINGWLRGTVGSEEEADSQREKELRLSIVVSDF